MNKALRLYILIILLATQYGCDKSKRIIGKSSFIEGNVTYLDPETSELKTNDSIEITLYKALYNDKGVFSQIATVKNSSFIFGPLETGSYRIKCYYRSIIDTSSNSYISYKRDTNLIIESDQQIFRLNDFKLETVEATNLRVLVMDSAKLPLQGMHVCLYQNPVLIDTSKQCLNSDYSTITDINGFANFTQLINTTYYYKAWGNVGGKLYNNFFEGAKLHTEGPLIEGLTTDTILLRSQHITNTRLKISVVDTAGYPLPNVTVCLYRNPTLLDTTYSCNSEEASQKTGNDGSTLFEKLDPVKYYFKTWVIYNDKKFNNFEDDSLNNTIIPIIEDSLNVRDVVLDEI